MKGDADPTDTTAFRIDTRRYRPTIVDSSQGLYRREDPSAPAGAEGVPESRERSTPLALRYLELYPVVRVVTLGPVAVITLSVFGFLCLVPVLNALVSLSAPERFVDTADRRFPVGEVRGA
ncbi:hypothetical protein [Methanopyrus kandleri]